MRNPNKASHHPTSFRQSIVWLHTWSGLIFGWVLYFMFLTGTLGYFDTEIDRWMKPELSPASNQINPLDVTKTLLPVLEKSAPGANSWTIAFAIDRNQPYPQIFWNNASLDSGAVSKNGNISEIDLATGKTIPSRATNGGQTLYRMHYRLHYLPTLTAYWLVGLLSMFMLAALVTGVIIHKRIFIDFFKFRPKRGLTSWLDAHNVLSVMALPFHLMITYSGLVFMGSIYMPLIISGFYDGGLKARAEYSRELRPPIEIIEAIGTPTKHAPLAPIFNTVNTRWGSNRIRYVEFHNPGDENARIVFTENIDDSVIYQTEQLIFDAISGNLLRIVPTERSSIKNTSSLLTSLHEGLFAKPLLRWFYFLSGLLGAGMIATGLILWAAKRRIKAERNKHSQTLRGLSLVERLNIGTIIGLPTAIAAYFWANRLLPNDLQNRAEWEVHCLFLTWLTLLVHAAARPKFIAWKEQLFFSALAFTCLPILNALTTDRHLGVSIFQGDWVFVGFDLTVLAIGLVCVFILILLNASQRKPKLETYGK